MKRVITESERNEPVNKGFLVDYLEEVLDKKFDEKLEGYVTKDYLKEYVDSALSQQTLQIEHRMVVLMEHQIHQLQTIFESLDDRYVLRREWLAPR